MPMAKFVRLIRRVVTHLARTVVNASPALFKRPQASTLVLVTHFKSFYFIYLIFIIKR